jgi:hypothetical protein
MESFLLIGMVILVAIVFYSFGYGMGKTSDYDDEGCQDDEKNA